VRKSTGSHVGALGWCLLLGGCLLTGVLSGCSNGSDPSAAIARVNETNLQRLANLYFTYQSKHNWRGPGDEAEFKAFLRSYNPDKLTRIGIDPNKLDELFVSERDGQPFKIRYGVPGSAMGSSEPVIFEATGTNGTRLVGFLNMEQREVDAAEYDALWSAAPKPAAPRSANSAAR
jgi:hypothetical protein